MDLAGASGATLGELMDRMGHSTTRAAPIYQYRTTERDRAIAATIGQLAEVELSQRRSASGTWRARTADRTP